MERQKRSTVKRMNSGKKDKRGEKRQERMNKKRERG